MPRFEIQPMDWHKRRAPSAEPKPLSVSVSGFNYEANTSCDLAVTYDDGVERVLKGRIIHNQQFDRWLINGINSDGYVLLVKVFEQ